MHIGGGHGLGAGGTARGAGGASPAGRHRHRRRPAASCCGTAAAPGGPAHTCAGGEGHHQHALRGEGSQQRRAYRGRTREHQVAWATGLPGQDPRALNDVVIRGPCKPMQRSERDHGCTHCGRGVWLGTEGRKVIDCLLCESRWLYTLNIDCGLRTKGACREAGREWWRFGRQTIGTCSGGMAVCT